MRFLHVIILAFGIGGHISKSNAAVIAGEVQNSSTKSIQIMILEGFNRLLADEFFVKIDRKKKFRHVVEMDLPGIIFLDGFQIYLEPSDSIFLTYDQENIRNSIQFSGDRVDENLFMLDFQESIAEFIQNNCFDLVLDEHDFLESYLSGSYSEAFENFLATKVKYSIITSQLNTIFREVIMENKEERKEELIALIDRNLDEISFSSPPYFASSDYYYFLDWYGVYQVALKERYKGQFEPSNLELLKLQIYSEDLDETALEVISAEFIVRNQYSPIHYATIDSVYSSMVKRFPQSSYITKLEQYLPDSVPDHGEVELSFYEHDNQIEVGSFSKIVSGIGDKPVLVDIWATWCHPCIQQFKYLPDIKKEIGEEIDFLYLSVDELSKKGKVLELIDRFGLEGTHAFLNQDDLNHFGGLRIPRYLLYSSEGELLSGEVPFPGTGKYFVKHIRKYDKKR